MDKKVYENTRYQNIYRHKKNKNYIIMISKPVKTSISRIDNKKIIKIEDALKIRDNIKIKNQKGVEAKYKDNFDEIWIKYIDYCKKVKKLAFKTIDKKEQLYSRYFKNSFNKKISKLTRDDISNFIFSSNTTNKQKNEMLKILKAFFNWCIEEEYLYNSPTNRIKKYKVEKEEMKYWVPNELKQFLDRLEIEINSDDIKNIAKAKRIKLLILIQFCLGDRIGESRVLRFDSFDRTLQQVKIKHSINYDRKDNDYLSATKNYNSQREVDITEKLINEVFEYKQFLIEKTDYNIKDNDPIFYNYSTKKPFSDTKLRNDFYYYCEKANVKKIRLYDLRHTYVATMMAEGKELYLISPRIGHKNYSTTVNKYGHLSNKVKREVAECTDKYI